ncbi:hypothetical protein BT96DRAFT_1015874 [Gymnopus androsaceus JB14]|uniref:Mid2 domain-containing protein n=1 Tax=Gymnopus androsaceus JB14 TaxID=1447944 RepID=A0A6A4I321_9AGAR|nr:hypothetical protein BT96DRAFT_1015874 [Gymnopus androsaceus JB14]
MLDSTKFGNLLVVFLLLSFLFASGLAQQVTAVTLWQFGQGRLLEAKSTLALEPLGQLSDGSATTYLYQALNLATITTTNNAGLMTTVTGLSPTPRTIIASASGWIEPFSPTDNIACSLVNSEFGECFISGTLANSGTPTPEVFAVTLATSTASFTPILNSQTTTALPSTTSTTSLPSTTSTTAPVSTSSDTQSLSTGKHTAATRKIVGSALGGCAFVAISFTLFIIWRRHRLREIQNDLLPRTCAFKPTNGNVTISDSTIRETRALSFATAPTLEAASLTNTTLNPSKHHGQFNAELSPSNGFPAQQSISAINFDTSPQLLQNTLTEIAYRLRRLEGSGQDEEPPPMYDL